MNSYERYCAMIAGKPVDHLPRLPILMAFAANYIGSDYAMFASDHRVLVEANLRCAQDFDFDQVNTMSDPYRETQGFGAKIEYVSDGVPRCQHPPLLDDQNLKILLTPNPYQSERMRDRLNAVRMYKSRVFKQYSILGWVEGPAAEASDLRGLENFLVDLMDDDGYAEELMDICLENAIRFALAQLEAGADTIGIGDAICSQISPATYVEKVLPRQKRLVDAIHAAGGHVRLHICGNITHLLAGISTLGIQILDVDSMVSLKNARAILGPTVALMGNLNPVSDVMRSSPDRITEAVNLAFKESSGPFFIGAGCEIPIGTPCENLKALCRKKS